MISTDTLEDVTEFARQNEANFPILGDPEKTMSTSYGVLSERGFAKRWTFYINKEGVIDFLDKTVSVRTAGTDIANRLGELGYDMAAE